MAWISYRLARSAWQPVVPDEARSRYCQTLGATSRPTRHMTCDNARGRTIPCVGPRLPQQLITSYRGRRRV